MIAFPYRLDKKFDLLPIDWIESWIVYPYRLDRTFDCISL